MVRDTIGQASPVFSAYAPSGKSIAVARHGRIFIFDGESIEVIHRTTFTGSPLRPCGEKILVATRRDGLDGAWSILNIDANSGEVIRETSSPVIIPSISSSAFAPNNLVMAVGCRNGDLLIVSNAFGNVQ